MGITGEGNLRREGFELELEVRRLKHRRGANTTIPSCCPISPFSDTTTTRTSLWELLTFQEHHGHSSAVFVQEGRGAVTQTRQVCRTHLRGHTQILTRYLWYLGYQAIRHEILGERPSEAAFWMAAFNPKT